MRTKRIKTSDNSSSYDLSISDLMAALCCIFLLFLVVTIIKLNQQKAEYSAKNGIAENYRSKQKKLYSDLQDEFKEDLKNWDAYITPDLTIHFRNYEALFKANDDKLQPKFESILKELFPRLVKILIKDDYIDEILEIRIEGHTARADESIRKGLSTVESDYEEGVNLSQRRTTKVLLHCLSIILPYGMLNNESYWEWVRKRIIAVGYSNSLPVINKDGTIDYEASRRVEIKIKTKAESVITEIQELAQNLGKVNNGN